MYAYVLASGSLRSRLAVICFLALERKLLRNSAGRTPQVNSPRTDVRGSSSFQALKPSTSAYPGMASRCISTRETG